MAHVSRVSRCTCATASVRVAAADCKMSLTLLLNLTVTLTPDASFGSHLPNSWCQTVLIMVQVSRRLITPASKSASSITCGRGQTRIGWTVLSTPPMKQP